MLGAGLVVGSGPWTQGDPTWTPAGCPGDEAQPAHARRGRHCRTLQHLPKRISYRCRKVSGAYVSTWEKVAIGDTRQIKVSASFCVATVAIYS